MSWKLARSNQMTGKLTFPQLLQLWMFAWTMQTWKNIASHKNDGGSCDDWPLQETLPMKQHRKLLGWDKKSWRRRSEEPEDEAMKVSRQWYRTSSDGRTVELSCSDVSFGWKRNKFLLWEDWGEIWDQNVDISNQHGHSVAFCGCKCLSNKIKRVSTEYSTSCFFLPAQSWQLKAIKGF